MLSCVFYRHDISRVMIDVADICFRFVVFINVKPANYRAYPVCSFLTRCVPSYSALSMAAATVSVPPITAQTPTRKPEKLLLRASRLMTFIGEMSCKSSQLMEQRRGRSSAYI